MPDLDVPLERIRFGQTSRKDKWWLHPLVWSIFFLIGFTYLGVAIFWPYHYWAGNNGYPYLTPLASPLFFGEGPHALLGAAKPSWWPQFLPLIPGLFIAPFPAAFRLSCYYYRGAYYKALWADPPACAVGEPRKEYRGEHKLPLILMNIHRYALYFGIALVVFLAYDAIMATRFPVSPGSKETTFGVGLGTVLMAVNVVFVALYTFSCHSFRHIVGGVVDIFSRSPARKKAWDCVTCLNKRHGNWAWFSLYTMCTTDLYIRLCSAGVIHDWRIF
jgi:hypothetical protein